MPYSQFTTIAKAKRAFGLSTLEGQRLLPPIDPIAPSAALSSFLTETLPIASVGSEKARSELIISPILIEVRRLRQQQISIFSGEDFTIDESLGLNGICDFLISRSPEILSIEAPAIIIVEAKKADIATGLGQCAAEMLAAQRFNQEQQRPIETIWGIVTNGILWRFLKLEGTVVSIDSIDFSLPPVDQILGILVWMTQTGTA
ncbi:MAG: hypothetical protein HC824_00220 [Synechococcales cyanobacterium RM1_1_8]|nr:hypothetical protein [Synechococcales cyanobacterium RM1_1_8]